MFINCHLHAGELSQISMRAKKPKNIQTNKTASPAPASHSKTFRNIFFDIWRARWNHDALTPADWQLRQTYSPKRFLWHYVRATVAPQLKQTFCMLTHPLPR